MSAEPLHSLYVGDLHREVSEGTVFEHFNKVGPLASVRVCRDSSTHESLGYAYVNFKDPADAQRAIDTLNFTPIRGVPCRIMRSQRDLTLRKSGLGNIFVKNLPERVDNKNLYDLFSVFGNILSAKVAAKPDGKSKGYGYVHFETENAAEEAILKMNDHVVDEQTIQVEKFLPKANRGEVDSNGWTNVYIQNIPATWTDDDLMELVKEFGNVQSAVVKSRVVSGTPRHFAFANFTQHDMALACVAGLNDREIEGQKISASEALTKKELARRRITLRRNQPNPHHQRYQPMHPGMPYMAPMYPPFMGGGYPYQYQYQYQYPNQSYPRKPRQERVEGGEGKVKKTQNLPFQSSSVVVVPAAPVETPSLSSYAQTLANMDPQEQKNSLGEALYPMIYNKNPSLAGKITGMLLEMHNAEILNLLESPEALNLKFEEALEALNGKWVMN